MALPNSGQLYIGDTAGTSRSIAYEVTGSADGPVTLSLLAQKADIGTTAYMSDFYGHIQPKLDVVALFNEYPDGLRAAWTYSNFNNPPYTAHIKFYQEGVFAFDIVADLSLGTSTTGIHTSELEAESSYYVVIDVYNALFAFVSPIIASGQSSSVVYKTQTPTNLVTTLSINNGTLISNWDGVPGNAGYRIERSADGGPWVLRNTQIGTQYIDNDDFFVWGTTYQYRVQATVDGVDSDFVYGNPVLFNPS